MDRLLAIQTLWLGNLECGFYQQCFAVNTIPLTFSSIDEVTHICSLGAGYLALSEVEGRAINTGLPNVFPYYPDKPFGEYVLQRLARMNDAYIDLRSQAQWLRVRWGFPDHSYVKHQLDGDLDECEPCVQLNHAREWAMENQK